MLLSIIFIISMFDLVLFIKIWHIAILRPHLPEFLISGEFQISYLWLTNLTRFSWNEGIDTCFNVECVLLGRNFDFLGGYLVVTTRNLVITARYCSFPLLVWTRSYGVSAYNFKAYFRMNFEYALNNMFLTGLFFFW